MAILSTFEGIRISNPSHRLIGTVDGKDQIMLDGKVVGRLARNTVFLNDVETGFLVENGTIKLGDRIRGYWTQTP